MLGGGEGAGPLAPPDQITQISDDTYASAAQAAAAAYAAAGLEGARDVDYFSIYDCFPVCFIRLVGARVALPWHVIKCLLVCSRLQQG